MYTARILVAIFNGVFGTPVKQAIDMKPGFPAPYEKPTTQIIIKIGNMMKLPVDAVVNAANSDLVSGGGIDGIITANRDPQTGAQLVPAQGDTSGKILQQYVFLKRMRMSPITQQSKLPVGTAIITDSGTIKQQQARTIRYVISTVGPQGPQSNDVKNKQLYDAYFNALMLACNHDQNAERILNRIDQDLALQLLKQPIQTIAFPSISTGIYSYPVIEASALSLRACLDFVREHPHALKKIYLVFLSEQDHSYQALQEFIREYKKIVDDPCVDCIRFEK